LGTLFNLSKGDLGGPMQAPYQIFKKLSDNRFVWVENIEELHEARGRLAHLSASSEADYILFDPRAKTVVARHA